MRWSTKTAVGIAGAALLTTANLGLGGATAQTAPRRLVSFTPAYHYPGVSTGPDRAIWTAWQSGSGVMVANQNSGMFTAIDTNYNEAINDALAAGSIVIGYVSTNYGLRAEADVRRDIDSWYSIYPQIKGIFLDEGPVDCALVPKYQSIVDYVSGKQTAAFITLNPGVAATPQCFDGVANALVTFEGPESAYATATFDSWQQTAQSAIVHIVHSSTTCATGNVSALNDRALAVGADYIYVTQELNNYTLLPSCWNSEASLAGKGPIVGLRGVPTTTSTTSTSTSTSTSTTTTTLAPTTTTSTTTTSTTTTSTTAAPITTTIAATPTTTTAATSSSTAPSTVPLAQRLTINAWNPMNLADMPNGDNSGGAAFSSVTNDLIFGNWFGSQWRSFIQFDPSQLSGRTVRSAKLSIPVVSCDNQARPNRPYRNEIGVHRLTSPYFFGQTWSGPSWNGEVWAEVQGANSVAKVDVTKFVRAWATDPTTNFGFMLDMGVAKGYCRAKAVNGASQLSLDVTFR